MPAIQPLPLAPAPPLFPEIFGQPYRPSRSTHRGRPPKQHFRIPRSLAHVQIIKHREGKRVTQIKIRYAHGSRQRVAQALAFARRSESKVALGWWGVTVYT